MKKYNVSNLQTGKMEFEKPGLFFKLEKFELKKSFRKIHVKKFISKNDN